MMSLQHIPTRLNLSVLNLVSRSAMAPPTCMECALSYLCLKPTCELAIATASLRDLVISGLLISDYLFLWYNAAIGVWLPATCCRRCATLHLIYGTSHDLVWPVSPFSIDYLLTPFLWLSKRKLTKSAEVPKKKG